MSDYFFILKLNFKIMASYVTKEGLDKMKAELEQLEKIERPKITQQIAEARDKGDLSENAEYDAAKEAQGMLEMRISKLKDIVTTSKVIDETQLDTSKVSILTTVKLLNNDTKKEQVFTLVPDNESDLKSGKISVNTPIAKGLLGKVVGETAEIVLPNGNKLSFEVLEITL
ncbi:MAG: Transcription elongation factor GreA [Chryseobacterium indoltheticum]|jgi:transcription elongation factor GreA|nr:Transcription elongation factor GreA [Chryseobacterium indoltheticum]